MRRYLLLLLNEFRLSRTALVVHSDCRLQPTLMYYTHGGHYGCSQHLICMSCSQKQNWDVIW